MSKKLSLGGELISKINFAMNQNYVPIIRFLTLFNETEEDMRNITLKISFEPDFIKPYEQKIEVLNPQKPIEISPPQGFLSRKQTVI